MTTKNRTHYKRWLQRFLILFTLLLLSVGIFNSLIDGVGVFRLNKSLRYAADSLLSGKMVAGSLGLYDERELHRLIVEKYQGHRDVILVGSSRTQPLRSKSLGQNVDFFNHSLSGAGIEDYVAVIGLYREKGLLPGTVIFGIDPWIFNRNNGLLDAWKALDRPYREMMSQMHVTGGESRMEMISAKIADQAKKYGQLINLAYTMQNWDSMMNSNRLYAGDAVRVTDTVDIDDFVRLPDGSVYFPYILRHAKQVLGEANAKQEMKIKYFHDYTSMYHREIFEKLVAYLQARDVRVVFLMPPLHPALYDACHENPKYSMVVKVDEYLRQLAKQRRISVIGSLNPRRYGLKDEDFFDWYHGHDQVMERLFLGYK